MWIVGVGVYGYDVDSSTKSGPPNLIPAYIVETQNNKKKDCVCVCMWPSATNHTFPPSIQFNIHVNFSTCAGFAGLRAERTSWTQSFYLHAGHI